MLERGVLTVDIIAGITPPSLGDLDGSWMEAEDRDVDLERDARNDNSFGIIDLNAAKPESESSRNNFIS